jgi:hypothetical protein
LIINHFRVGLVYSFAGKIIWDKNRVPAEMFRTAWSISNRSPCDAEIAM